jgi:hypothetical protein
VDAVVQTLGFVLQLLAAGVVTWLLWRDRAQTR